PEQPLPARLLARYQGAYGQRLPAAWHHCRGDPATDLHLRAAIPGNVRQRSRSAPGLALAARRWLSILSHRRGGETYHSLVRLLAEAGGRDRGRCVSDPLPRCFRVRVTNQEWEVAPSREKRFSTRSRNMFTRSGLPTARAFT